jgi:acyl-CoA synthetase (AMP-forming)/AMP-acid ligase II
MEQGSKTLLITLVTALLMGALVVALNPAYRQAFFALVRGEPAASPIWTSNRDYYPDVALPASAPPPSNPLPRDRP